VESSPLPTKLRVHVSADGGRYRRPRFRGVVTADVAELCALGAGRWAVTRDRASAEASPQPSLSCAYPVGTGRWPLPAAALPWTGSIDARMAALTWASGSRIKLSGAVRRCGAGHRLLRATDRSPSGRAQTARHGSVDAQAGRLMRRLAG
jgi:hypothetical protein